MADGFVPNLRGAGAGDFTPTFLIAALDAARRNDPTAPKLPTDCFYVSHSRSSGVKLVVLLSMSRLERGALSHRRKQ
jgi:hypothetical protein